ncbi:hypothetical protein [Marinilabilia sp.]|uniref:hypothetical protein n=1 Tax=Marinilabilia sp. TaxID=2021252 RepID=UPI0025C64152|nr:hypothetical protein [Marinilabilia sp.]
MLHSNPPLSGMDQLIHKLKNEDENYARLSRGIQIFYWIMAPVYLIMVVLHAIEGSSLNEILGGIFFFLAMLIFALFFRNYYKEYKYVDYSQPTLVMLKKAAYRYKPFQLKILWAFLAVGFINAGLSLSATHMADLLEIQLVFWSAMAMAVLIGLWRWKVRYKPIRDAALNMIREIEADY